MQVGKGYVTLALVLAMVPCAIAAQSTDSEIIMRRPLPMQPNGSGGSPTPTPTPTPPDILVPPGGTDEVIPENYNPEAGYYAYAQCSSGTMVVTCNEIVVNTDTWPSEIVSHEEVDRSLCSYGRGQLWAADGHYTIPAGAHSVKSSDVNRLHGTSCDGTEFEYIEMMGYYCDRADVICSQVTVQNYNGSMQAMAYEDTETSRCVLPSSHAQQPGYEEFVIDQGFKAVYPDVLNTGCQEYDNPPEGGIIVSNGYCSQESYSDGQGGWIINDIYEWNCGKILDFDAEAMDYRYISIANNFCENADQSPEARQIIADYLVGDYDDPQSVNKNCSGGGSVYGDWKVEIRQSPVNYIVPDEHTNGARLLVRPRNGDANYGTFLGINDNTEVFEFYCHRYDFSIFQAIAQNPEIAEDSEYVSHANDQAVCTQMLSAEISLKSQPNAECIAQRDLWTLPDYMEGASPPICADGVGNWESVENEMKGLLYIVNSEVVLATQGSRDPSGCFGTEDCYAERSWLPH